MCFYFGLPSSVEKLEKRFKKKFVAPNLFIPNEKYNGFEHPSIAIISKDDMQLSIGIWGLLPKWATDTSFQKNTLNARIETLTSIPSFKDYTVNRCLIPASCFYEWRHEGKNKIPYTIYNNENEIFCFAGIYSDWFNTTTQKTIRTITIVTTQANENMAYIHNTKKRMPVILKEQDEKQWLTGDAIENFAFPYSVQLIGFSS